MQIDLFQPDPIIAPAPKEVQTQSGWEYVAVVTHCPVCKNINSIAPHPAIHSFAWMDEHWEKLEEGLYRVVGTCSRECEEKQKKAS